MSIYDEYEDIDKCVMSDLSGLPKCECGKDVSYVVLMWTSDYSGHILDIYTTNHMWDNHRAYLHEPDVIIGGHIMSIGSIIIPMCKRCVSKKLRTYRNDWWIIDIDSEQSNQFRGTLIKIGT